MTETVTDEKLQLERDHALAKVIIEGDLSKLTDRQKIQVYISRCIAAGLNWRTLPYDYLRLKGKETLFLNARGVSQLNNIHKIGHTVPERLQFYEDGCSFFRVTAVAIALDGRREESMAEVPLSKPEEVEEEFEDKGRKLKRLVPTGEYVLLDPLDRCNARMKTETKAKERSTKSLIGEGGLTQSDVDAIPGAEIIQGPMPTEEMAAELGYTEAQVKGAIEDKGTIVETGTTIKISEPAEKVQIPKPVSGAKEPSVAGDQTAHSAEASATNAQSAGSEPARQTQSTPSEKTPGSVSADSATAIGKPDPKPPSSSGPRRRRSANAEPEAKQEDSATAGAVTVIVAPESAAPEPKSERPGEEQLSQLYQSAVVKGLDTSQADAEICTFFQNRGIDLENLYETWTWKDFEAAVAYLASMK